MSNKKDGKLGATECRQTEWKHALSVMKNQPPPKLDLFLESLVGKKHSS